MRGTLQLTPIEARVIAALAEKSVTTPQYYPMTVNAIMLAASQKSSRNPVMSIAEGEVGAALHRLEGEGLVKRDGRCPSCARTRRGSADRPTRMPWPSN